MLKINNKGFTLIELMAVLVMMFVFTSVAYKKYNVMTEVATRAAVQKGLTELNTREMQVWILAILERNYQEDGDVWTNPEYDIELTRLIWVTKTQTGGILTFDGDPVTLIRTPSTRTAAGRWSFV